MQPQFAEHRPVHRIHEDLVVMVPGDNDDLATVFPQCQQCLNDRALRPRIGRRGLEEVPWTMLRSTATCLSCRSRPLRTLPTCQSLV